MTKHTGPRRAPRSRGPMARSIHFVDIENLCGGGHPAPSQVRQVREVYDVAATVTDDDLIVIGGGPVATLDAYSSWRSARFVMRLGPDGADLALLEAMTHRGIADRFARVIIGSGDGIFTDAAADLGAAGCHVVVVARRGALARRLQMAAAEVRYIDVPTTNPGAAIRRAA